MTQTTQRAARDIPIIFSGRMVRAHLENLKTQTRRLASSPLAKAEPGDRLWARETVACGACAKGPPSHWSPSFWRREQGSAANPNGLWYMADGLAPERPITDRGRWAPAIHQPRWASRLTLVVVEKRFMRLQDISSDDAKAEGIVWEPGVIWTCSEERGTTDAYRSLFADLWDSLHGKKPGESWKDNPPVVALSYSVHHCNIDQLPARGAA